MKVGNASYASPGDLPATIPVFPLPGALLLGRVGRKLVIPTVAFLQRLELEGWDDV